MEPGELDNQEHNYEEVEDFRFVHIMIPAVTKNEGNTEYKQHSKNTRQLHVAVMHIMIAISRPWSPIYDQKITERIAPMLQRKCISCSRLTLGFLLAFIILAAVTAPMVLFSMKDMDEISNTGNSSESRTCPGSPHCSVWDSWTSWGACDIFCGGEKNRTRVCISRQNTSEGCPGSNTETGKCELCSDCGDVFITQTKAGVYKLQPEGSAAFDAYCDQGWTTIMKRYDGSLNFFLYWDDYKHGFGNKLGEHWLGNDNLYYLTNQGNYTLRLEFTYWKTKHSYYAEYSNFKVANESDKYRLAVSDYRGNSGKDALSIHNNQVFSTRDRDNPRECAYEYDGAFWYHTHSGVCHDTNPTGPYRGTPHCMHWRNTCISDFIIKMKRQ